MPVPQRIVYTHGDTAPALDLTFARAGRPVPITGPVTATVYRPVAAGPNLSKALTVLDGPHGRARLSWAAGDLVCEVAEPYDYLVELHHDGETAPDPVRIEVRSHPGAPEGDDPALYAGVYATRVEFEAHEVFGHGIPVAVASATYSSGDVTAPIDLGNRADLRLDVTATGYANTVEADPQLLFRVQTSRDGVTWDDNATPGEGGTPRLALTVPPIPALVGLATIRVLVVGCDRFVRFEVLTSEAVGANEPDVTLAIVGAAV